MNSDASYDIPFMPHGHCYLWTPSLVGLHAISDLLIVLAYFSIPITLVYFVRKRKDIEFNWMFVCFAVFIMACGTTHLMEIWNIWHANYWLSGGIKALTAVASVPTAILLVKLVPHALAIPSTAQLNRANEALQAEVVERKQAEARLREANESLEARVSERTQELARTNAALRVNEHRFRLVVEGSPHAMIVVNEQGHITLVNMQAEKLFGYTRQELLDSPVEMLVPDRYHNVHPGHRSSFFQKPELRPMGGGRDLFGRRKDGAEVPVEIGLNPITTADGPCVLASVIDITERKEAEAKLRESEERFRQIAESLPQLVWTCERDGMCDFLSQRWMDYTGVPGEKQLGAAWLAQVHPDDHERLSAAWKKALAAGALFHCEFRIRRHDGVYRWFDTRAAPLRDGSGRIVKWFGSNTDIHDQKLAEEKIHQLNSELEQRVTARTAELEAANHELESFSYSISHDLRAPIRAMSGFARILCAEQAERLSTDARRQLDRIHANAVRMGQLVDGLLAFSKLSRQPLKRQRVNPADLARRVLEELHPEQADRHVEIKVTDLPPCDADPTLLQQVLANLISNALKYTRDCKPAKIEVGSRDSDGQTVYFVKDNGAGFDMRYVEKLFGVFQRLHTAEQFEGTGVGLAIVQRIVHRHGGKVWAEAEVGKGATFSFTIGDDDARN